MQKAKIKLQMLLQKLLNLRFKIPFHNDKTLTIAFEFGLILTQVAKEMSIEITPEITLRAEEVLIKELKLNGTNKTAINFIPLILAVLELK